MALSKTESTAIFARLTPATSEKVDEVAAAEGRTRSNLIGWAMAFYLKQKYGWEDPTPRKR